MTELELVRHWYETRDPKLFSHDVKFTICKTFPYSGTYHGAKAIYEDFFGKLLSRFAEFRVERDLELQDGMTVIIVGRYVGKVTVASSEFEVPFTHVWQVKDGMVLSVQQHAETALLNHAFDAAA
ncbi:nuclear transport factor 2 family protein [Kiloniella sp. EL199]|uniref:nuclear transport factor 2 family protein n=1 Tax=Kiloniella sp. EL199 TaxID=2107581 RepID=UPI000EA2587E|nr:nuclear transport factor 2 family protein [Kiloniella sp. EL199]